MSDYTLVAKAALNHENESVKLVAVSLLTKEYIDCELKGKLLQMRDESKDEEMRATINALLDN